MPYFYRNPDAPKPNLPDSLGVVAFIERDNALLLEARRDDGRWGLIGGRVECDESLGDAVIREVAEETALTVTGYTLFGTFSDPSRIIQYPDGSVMRFVSLVYRVAVADFATLRRSHESRELRFFTRDELAALEVVETHRHIVDHYLSPPPAGTVILVLQRRFAAAMPFGVRALRPRVAPLGVGEPGQQVGECPGALG
jgi:ADP-ribose pyrophosphatase YjhB (NUDIX family)